MSEFVSRVETILHPLGGMRSDVELYVTFVNYRHMPATPFTQNFELRDGYLSDAAAARLKSDGRENLLSKLVAIDPALSHELPFLRH